MTAGRGIEHREVAQAGARAHVLQLWIDLPARDRAAAPGHQELPAADRPRLSSPGAEVDVLAGTVDGVTGPARPARPVQAVLVTLDPGASLELAMPAEHRAFALVLDGGATVAGRFAGLRQTAWSDPGGSRLELGGGATGSRLLVVGARPTAPQDP
jgi:redox-sensitive bicupin YhaK (pirin superfamily)